MRPVNDRSEYYGYNEFIAIVKEGYGDNCLQGHRTVEGDEQNDERDKTNAGFAVILV